MKAFIFTPLIASTSFDRPVIDVIVKRLKFPFRGCVGKRSVKLNAYKLSEWEFSFKWYQTPHNFKSYTPEYIITGCNGTIPRLVNKAMQVAMRIFIGNNNKTVWGNLFSVIDRYATSNRVQNFRLNVYPFIIYLIIGVRGKPLYSPSINFIALMQVTDLHGVHLST